MQKKHLQSLLSNQVLLLIVLNFVFQQADVGIGLFSVVEERLEVVNYTTFLGADTFTILMKNIERVSKVESIVAPFNIWV